MPGGYVASVPPYSIADGTAVTASATLTELSPLPQKLFAANELGRQGGTLLSFEAGGVYTTTATPGTITLGLYSNLIGVGIATTPITFCATAATTWILSQTNRQWMLWGTLQIRATGASGTSVAMGQFANLTGTSPTANTDLMMTAAGGTVTIDTTVARYIALGATISVASQSITCRYFNINSLN